MSKLLKIVLSVVGISLFYLWICTMFQACGNKKSSQDSQTEALGELASGDEEIIDVSDEDFFEDDIDYSEDNSEEESFEELESNLVSDKPVSNTKQNTQQSSSGTTRTATSSSGDYLLISGNYLVQSNAQEMLSKLQNMGYANAEIVIFDRSQYHTVIASRFSSYETALQSASMLKQKGVDCYVKKKS